MHTSAVLNPPRSNRLRPRDPALILTAGFCGGFVSFGSLLVFTFGIFLKPLTAEFGWSRGQVSLAFTVAALTVALCSPYTGRLLDRYPARYIVLPCMSIYGVAFGSLSLLTGHLWHLLALFVVRNGSSVFSIAQQTIIPELLALNRVHCFQRHSVSG